MSNAQFLVSGPPEYFMPSDIDGTEVAPWHTELYVHSDTLPAVLEGTAWRPLQRGDRVTLCYPWPAKGPAAGFERRPFGYATVDSIVPVDGAHIRVTLTDPQPI